MAGTSGTAIFLVIVTLDVNKKLLSRDLICHKRVVILSALGEEKRRAYVDLAFTMIGKGPKKVET